MPNWGRAGHCRMNPEPSKVFLLVWGGTLERTGRDQRTSKRWWHSTLVRYAVEDCEYGQTGQSMLLRLACGAWKRGIDVVHSCVRVDRRDLRNLPLFSFFGFYEHGARTFVHDEPV